jgi:hypothetical protein
MKTPTPKVDADLVQKAHRLYCDLTGQILSLGFDRERMWFELLRAGYSLEDLHNLITYLLREIRIGRRNFGALKLSNLLQPDRFEEDLQISRLRLRPPSPPPSLPPPPPEPVQAQQARQRALQYLRQLKESLR